MDGTRERIEIELVPNDPAPSRAAPRHRQALDAEPDAPGGGSADEPPDGAGAAGDTAGTDGDRERTRLIVSVATVGVVALVVGLLLGRTSGSSGGPETAAEATAATETSAPDDPGRSTIAPVDDDADDAAQEQASAAQDAEDALEEAFEETPTVGPPNPRGTAQPDGEVVVGPIGIDPRLAGLDVRLVGMSTLNKLVEIDLATGTSSEIALGSRAAAYAQVVAGDEWTLVAAGDGSAPFLVGRDGEIERTRIGADGLILKMPEVDRFWRVTNSFGIDGTELQLVDLDGSPTGPSMRIPPQAWPAMTDPAGGVIVQASGRWFTIPVDPAGNVGVAQLLGIGEPIAIGEDVSVFYDCGVDLVCGLWQTDRATGDSVPLPVDPETQPSRYIPSYWYGADPGAGLTPDGRRLATLAQSPAGSRSTVVVDLASGRVDVVDESNSPSSSLWVGQFLVYLSSGGVLRAYDVEAGVSFDVLTDTPVTLMTLVARPFG